MKRKPSKSTPGSRLPFLIGGVLALLILSSVRIPEETSGFNIVGFAKLPVLNGGRVKPLDTLARSSLLQLSGKQSFRVDGREKTAIVWLLDVFFRPSLADTYLTFEIDDPDVLGALNIRQTRQRTFSYDMLKPSRQEINRLAALAKNVKADDRSRFQSAVLTVDQRLSLYERLKNTLTVSGETDVAAHQEDFESRMLKELLRHFQNASKTIPSFHDVTAFLEQARFLDQAAAFYSLPVSDENGQIKWLTMGEGLFNRIRQPSYHPGVLAYAAMGDAFRSGDPDRFNAALGTYRDFLEKRFSKIARRGRQEFLFNTAQPFGKSMLLYLAAFLLAVLSWIVRPAAIRQTGFAVLIVAFFIHTVGLITRIWLQGRPPVTNLYSSAVFVGWVSVLLGIVLERLFRRGLGTAAASLIGFITLIIAHHLAAQGDTMEMMRAVLDSNFWLATHVVTITIGYGSTFIAGFLGILYLVRRAFDQSFTKASARSLEKMVFGVVCFATFFSFLGTILGGIWADQSWGRFWGWDPKENGALMIVLWNAFILHARWGRIVSPKGIVTLAVFGNVVTALSWFGVNMLGIGLHSYGFMDKALFWLMAFIAAQFLIMGFGFLKPRHRSL